MADFNRTPAVYDVLDRLDDAGFHPVTTVTHNGRLQEETYFNGDRIQITISYRYQDADKRPERIDD
jgi:dTDP-glucose pyrophosphorylase